MSAIQLKNEITPDDLHALERWMSDGTVTRYLNEHSRISAPLRAAYRPNNTARLVVAIGRVCGGRESGGAGARVF